LRFPARPLTRYAAGGGGGGFGGLGGGGFGGMRQPSLNSLDHLVGAGEQRCQNSAHTGTDFKFLQADTV
jgi:hypothetical protein